MRRLAIAVVLGVLLLSAPAYAENPVYDADTAADIADGLADATQVQGVCYAVVLDVSDPSGQWGGVYVVSSAGVGVRPPLSGCKGVVELRAYIAYASEYSEAADTASWVVDSSLGGVSADDLDRNGFSASDLLNDGKSEQVLLNAALALPRLTAEVDRSVPPIVLTPETAAPPADARATEKPGSDQIRQNRSSLIALGLVALGGLVWAFSLVRAARRPPVEYEHHESYASGRLQAGPSPDEHPRPEWY